MRTSINHQLEFDGMSTILKLTNAYGRRYECASWALVESRTKLDLFHSAVQQALPPATG